MAVTKRTRYEVLKRDNHTCRYCGASAPDAKLTVDHVTPLALGGSDDPSNLVAACQECNAGKASTTPDAPLVEDVKAIDVQWAAAIKRAAAMVAEERRRANDYLGVFEKEWCSWDRLDKADPDSVERLYRAGLPVAEMLDCIRVAQTAWNVRDRFSYFMGVSWKRIGLIQETAKQILEAEEA